MRGVGGYDGYGCNYDVCVPECRYFAKEGRIEDEEWKLGMKTKEE